MKVYEIIAESSQLAEISFGGVADRVSGWFGRDEAGMAKLSLKAFLEKTSNDVAQQAVAKGVTPSKIIADKVANIASDEARIQQEIERVANKNGTTMTKEQAIDYINARARKKKQPPLATEKDVLLDEKWQDPSFQDQIKKAANKRLRTNNYGPNATNVGAGTGGKVAAGAAGVGVVGGVVEWATSMGAVEAALTAANIYEFYKAYSEFASRMQSASEHRKDNSWTSAQYQETLNQETMILISTWAELVIAPAIIKKLFNFVGNTFTLTASGRIIKWIAGKFPKFASAVNGATNVMIRDWINENDNAKWLAVQIGTWLGSAVPGIAEAFQAVGSAINPWFPSDPKPGDNTAASPNGTTNNGQAAVNATSTDGAGGQYQGTWHIDPLTGKDAQGRQFYDKNPNAIRNWDVTDWVTGPDNNFIQNPKNPVQILSKPVWWHVDPSYLTKDQLRLKTQGDD